ncbi:hypothetical protein [Nocardioides sp. Arc9.136]|uniref:hypothetical protein n=1 Tax=Nocardioides sp. Arc9.136 TaxID=2996826 RepID=UPI00266531A0|nr:hypothetical protein [Nocardioides sp. Arc9.136]WKN47758.1 hypothetical protein OSR43_17175 [Nocardioides sp. Arc9.136]
MRDPIEDLEHFRTDGTTVNPLPASEVRRRGDRMRRRTTALATAGGVAAALVAVAVPFGISRSGADAGRDISPAPPTVEWLEQAPEEFPLDDGYAFGSAVDEVATSIPAACGTPFWTTEGTTDVQGAAVYGGEAFDARTLMVYPDDTAAAEALAGIRDAVADCPEQTDADDTPDNTLVYDVLDQGLPTEDSFVFVERVRDEADGLLYSATTTMVGRSGNALLLDQSYGSAGGEQAVDFNLRKQLERAAVPLSDMCVFSATPCSRTTVVPGGFPLLDGVPTGAATTDPTRDLPPIVLEECGATVDVPEHTDLVRAGWSVPGEDRQRQLVTFADTEQARSYVEAVIGLYEECIESEEPDGRTQSVQAILDLGGYQQAGGAHLSWERDGEPVGGTETVAVVRVGAAVVLGTITSDEGVGPNGERIQQQTREAFESLDGVVAAMGDLRAP